MAAKAHVIGTAFLGMEMKCARCHDAPYHKSTQQDLFAIAGMLGNKPVTLPATSTVPASFFEQRGERESIIRSTLKPGTRVENAWPFTRHATVNDGTKPQKREASARHELAREITHPANRRFAMVIVNRLWQSYFGQGIVEPVHDWEQEAPSHPGLLDYLAREFVSSGYKLRHIHRLILNSSAYRRQALAIAPSSTTRRHFTAPLRRRMRAEQLVDSLFTATGVPFYSEELSFDSEGAHPPDVMQSLGTPQRAWQLVAISSERDRPSLTLPRASSILAVMEAFGWCPNRSEPIQAREMSENLLQPGMLGNGLFGIWQTRLSDYSDLTGMAMHAETPEEIVENLSLRFLTREPSPKEREAFVALLEPGFHERLKRPDGPAFRKRLYVPDEPEVTWANHLKAAANRLAAETEERVSHGPPPTDKLDPEWRERMEDLVWALINSPEMQYIP